MSAVCLTAQSCQKYAVSDACSSTHAVRCACIVPAMQLMLRLVAWPRLHVVFQASSPPSPHAAHIEPYSGLLLLPCSQTQGRSSAPLTLRLHHACPAAHHSLGHLLQSTAQALHAASEASSRVQALLSSSPSDRHCSSCNAMLQPTVTCNSRRPLPLLCSRTAGSSPAPPTSRASLARLGPCAAQAARSRLMRSTRRQQVRLTPEGDPAAWGRLDSVEVPCECFFGLSCTKSCMEVFDVFCLPYSMAVT